jgi:hypothetical protein
LEHEEKVHDEPLWLGAVFIPRPLHLTAEKDGFKLGRKIGVAVCEELVPDQLCAGVFASVKSPFTILVTSLLRKR